MEDIQSLLEKINREGVEKAEAEAAKIISAATAKAEGIVAAANAQAKKTAEEAEKAASDFEARASETVRQAARDLVIKVESSVKELLENILVKNVEAALGDEKAALQLVEKAIADISGQAEITCGPELAKALASQLAGKGTINVTIDDTAGSGFSVKVDGGRVESAFTSDVIADELAKRLRPELAKLLK